MSPFWGSFFDHLKSCGRTVTWFMLTLAGIFVAVVLGTLFCGGHFKQYAFRAVSGAGVLAAVWIGIVLRREQLRRRERLRFPPLSTDEWRKARTKLVKGRG